LHNQAYCQALAHLVTLDSALGLIQSNLLAG